MLVIKTHKKLSSTVFKTENDDLVFTEISILLVRLLK